MGLGNPGREYEHTRHNAGFMVIDELARRLNVASFRNKDGALQALVSAHNVVLLKPQSYMNLSGEPTRKIAAWYRTPVERILVVSDDMDIPFGTLRLRASGGHGGHNGLHSLIDHFGNEFPRLRVGVGRPANESIDHVLSPFAPDERLDLPSVIDAAATVTLHWLSDGLTKATQFANSWRINSTP